MIKDTELSCNGNSEDFFIGVFASEEQAYEIGRRYLREVPGFCDYPCEFWIMPRGVYGVTEGEVPDTVWFAQGWDENEHHDEINIIESDLFADKTRAESELDTMKKLFSRQEWIVERYRVGEELWSEGFCRVPAK